MHSLSRPRLGASHAVRGVIGVALDRLGVVGDFPIAIVLLRPGLGSKRIYWCVIRIKPGRKVEVGEGLVVLVRSQPVFALLHQLGGGLGIFLARLIVAGRSLDDHRRIRRAFRLAVERWVRGVELNGALEIGKRSPGIVFG